MYVGCCHYFLPGSSECAIHRGRRISHIVIFRSGFFLMFWPGLLSSQEVLPTSKGTLIPVRRFLRTKNTHHPHCPLISRQLSAWLSNASKWQDADVSEVMLQAPQSGVFFGVGVSKNHRKINIFGIRLNSQVTTSAAQQNQRRSPHSRSMRLPPPPRHRTAVEGLLLDEAGGEAVEGPLVLLEDPARPFHTPAGGGIDASNFDFTPLQKNPFGAHQLGGGCCPSIRQLLWFHKFVSKKAPLYFDLHLPQNAEDDNLNLPVTPSGRPCGLVRCL